MSANADGVPVPPRLQEVEYRTPEPGDAESLQFNVAVCFDGFRAFAPSGWSPPDELSPDAVEKLRGLLGRADCYALMAVYQGSPVAHVVWEPVDDRAHLRHLFVLEAWWGTGAAGALHERAVEAMGDRGRKRARLVTPAAQARARRFYERRGWTLGGIRPDPRLGLDLAEYRLRLR